jgi:Domain of unknown function (DUF6265)
MFFAALLVPVGGPRFPRSAAPAPAPLRWLAGCWHMERLGTVIDEQWLAPLGGMMLSQGRTVKNGAVVDYEFVILRVAGDGYTYEAHPSGQEPATFHSTKPRREDEIVFENPEHDFPQRVGYRRLGGDSALAWIEGVHGGVARRIEFPYARVSCSVP